MSTPKEDTNNSRRLSLPDLSKLREEWDRREAIQATAQLLPGKLQVKKKNYSIINNNLLTSIQNNRLIYSM